MFIFPKLQISKKGFIYFGKKSFKYKFQNIYFNRDCFIIIIIIISFHFHFHFLFSFFLIPS